MQVIIIGSGVAGLVAAQHLESQGLSPRIIDAAERAGGRVKTDTDQGFRFDHGFQVLLTNYQEVQRYLDLAALDLRHFTSGAIIFHQGHRMRIGDPLRDPALVIPMVFSSVGTLRDKWLMFRLAQELKRMDRTAVFARAHGSTLAYLRQYGFSDGIIETFFRPFFGGIFLENDLSTGAGMFRFVFKMFTEGSAALPAKGMEAIIHQLERNLHTTQFVFNTQVKAVVGSEIQLKDGQVIPFDKLIIATDPSSILPQLTGPAIRYVSTTNLYFAVDQRVLTSPTIALVSDHENPINNFCALTEVSGDYAPPGKHLLSVTLKAGYQAATTDAVIAALRKLLRQPELGLTLLKRFEIARALPVVEDLRFTMRAGHLAVNNQIFLAGDQLLNGSLDAAMRSGRLAAEALIQSL